jgi:hypothetical protein
MVPIKRPYKRYHYITRKPARAQRYDSSAKELKHLGFADSQLPAWMKKPASVEVVDDSTVTPVEVVETIGSLPVDTLVSLPMLDVLPNPLGNPIVETEEVEAPLTNVTVEAKVTNAALQRSNELTVEAEKPSSWQQSARRQWYQYNAHISIGAFYQLKRKMVPINTY